MSNNLEPSAAQFQRAEQPLIEIGRTMDLFAREIGGELVINYHGRPARDIVVESKDAITRKIELTTILDQPAKGWIDDNWAYPLTLHAWKDVPAGRMTWHSSVARFDAKQLLSVKMEELLSSVWANLQQVQLEQMQLFRHP